MSHEDKGRVSFSTPKAENTDELTALLNKTKAERDAELLAKAEKGKLELIETQKGILRRKFDEFLADDSSLKKVEAHDMEWAVNGFIIEIFVADFSTESKLIIQDDLFLKYSPYAKILSVSPLNEGVRKEWKVGDIVHLGDAIASVKINPNWEMYTAGGKSSGKVLTEEPIKYIRHIHDWINRGFLYALDKGDFMLDIDKCSVTEETMKRFKGPFVFRVEQYMIPCRVKGNPWA